MELVVSYPPVCSMILMLLWIGGICLGWALCNEFPKADRKTDECDKEAKGVGRR